MTKPNLNVTPLIDVLLVLLVIFMIVAPQKHQNYRGSIPRESTESGKTNPLSLIVEIGKNGEISLNRNLVGSASNVDKLTARLNEIFLLRTQNSVFKDSDNAFENRQIERTVFVKAPKQMNYGAVISVVDSIRAAGAQPISFQIDSLE